jgi:hypothetical protein
MCTAANTAAVGALVKAHPLLSQVATLQAHHLRSPAFVDQYSGFAGLASFFKLHMPCGHLPVGLHANWLPLLLQLQLLLQPPVGPQGPKLLTAARLYQLAAGTVGLPLTAVCTAEGKAAAHNKRNAVAE